MNDLEQRIERWTDAANKGVAPVSRHEIHEVAGRSRRRRNTALVAAAVLALFAATAVGFAVRAKDDHTVVAADRLAGQSRTRHDPAPTTSDPTRDPGSDDDIATLTAELAERGARVRREAARATPGLLPSARFAQLCVDGERVSVFEYETTEDRLAVSALISDDGSQFPAGDGGVIAGEWVDPPRFYARGRIIALAVGPSDELAHSLVSVLGPTLSPDAVAGRDDGVELEPC